MKIKYKTHVLSTPRRESFILSECRQTVQIYDIISLNINGQTLRGNCEIHRNDVGCHRIERKELKITTKCLFQPQEREMCTSEIDTFSDS